MEMMLQHLFMMSVAFYLYDVLLRINPTLNPIKRLRINDTEMETIMGFLQSIFKSRDKPQNATSGSAYRFFIGGSSSGKNVNERSAMQMTAVYSCVRILSETVASLPLHVYKYNGDGGKEKAKTSALFFAP